MSLSDRVELLQKAERMGLKNWVDENGKERLEICEVSKLYITTLHETANRMLAGINARDIERRQEIMTYARMHAYAVTEQHIRMEVDKWQRRGYKTKEVQE